MRPTTARPVTSISPNTPGAIAANVTLWGRPVGSVSCDDSGAIRFQYEDAFRSSGLEISPFHLPLSTPGPQEFPDNARNSFGGLPGVLADSLPDAFGRAVIKRYFDSANTPELANSSVHKLLLTGDRAMGALQFTPILDESLQHASSEHLTAASLMTEARGVIDGDDAVAIPNMIRNGASAGGARAKALILWNPQTQTMKSAFAPKQDGDENWIIKFDGVTDGRGGPEVKKVYGPGPYGRIEYAYSIIARRAGLEMNPMYLLRDGDYAHFLTRRFDRTDDDRRIHMQTLAGMRHIDYNIRGAFTYEQYLETVRQLNMSHDELVQAYRRTVFNIMACNQDDHVKNLGFLMHNDGSWHLTPAYDVTFAKGNAWTKTHQMTLAGKDTGFTRNDLETVGKQNNIPNTQDIIDETANALKTWKDAAAEAGLDRKWTDRIAGEFILLEA